MHAEGLLFWCRHNKYGSYTHSRLAPPVLAGERTFLPPPHYYLFILYIYIYIFFFFRCTTPPKVTVLG